MVPSEGPMYLRHGFRRPNFVPKFGASVMGIGPYALRGDERAAAGSSALRVVAESRRDCPGQRRTAERLRQRVRGMGGNRSRDHPKKGQQRRTIPQSRLRRDSSLYTREPSGTGDADCRVASLLAMTVLNLCHSEEAQRADVGIRLFYDGRGFGPPGRRPLRKVYQSSSNGPMWSSAPTGGCGDRPATAQAALSEAESAERAAGQIQSLPDTLRVQHGVLCPEVSARPRPCSRWYHLN